MITRKINRVKASWKDLEAESVWKICDVCRTEKNVHAYEIEYSDDNEFSAELEYRILCKDCIIVEIL